MPGPSIATPLKSGTPNGIELRPEVIRGHAVGQITFVALHNERECREIISIGVEIFVKKVGQTGMKGNLSSRQRGALRVLLHPLDDRLSSAAERFS